MPSIGTIFASDNSSARHSVWGSNIDPFWAWMTKHGACALGKTALPSISVMAHRSHGTLPSCSTACCRLAWSIESTRIQGGRDSLVPSSTPGGS